MKSKHDQAAVPVGKVVSLFSGCGGMDIGFNSAGFIPVWANDIDRFATRTYAGILPGHIVTTGNLLDQKLPNIPDLDLVIGGPPCQGFSIAGKMDPNDPRSKHVWNFMSVVKSLSPKGFVMENVKSLAVNSRWSELLANLTKEAENMGYKTRLFVLNACHYGVPQARERMFLIGLKNQVPGDIPPVTADRPNTLRDALRSLPAYGQPGNDSICTAKITLAKKPVLRRSPYAGMLFNGQGRPLDLDMPALTLPASMGGNRTPIVDQLEIQNAQANSWIREYHQHVSAGGIPEFPVANTLRRITVEEAAAIQTFPANMKFYGTQTTKFRQIGNAVPPLLAYHVAMAVRTTLYQQDKINDI